jgi:hypothetical protein
MNEIRWIVVDDCGAFTVVTGASVVPAAERRFSLAGEGGKLPGHPTVPIIGRFLHSTERLAGEEQAVTASGRSVAVAHEIDNSGVGMALGLRAAR